MLMHLKMDAISSMCSNKIELLLLYTFVQLRNFFSKALGQFYVFDSDHQKNVALIVTNYCTVANKFNDFLYSLVINLFDLL